jgi:hypothetical protein
MWEINVLTARYVAACRLFSSRTRRFGVVVFLKCPTKESLHVGRRSKGWTERRLKKYGETLAETAKFAA